MDFIYSWLATGRLKISSKSKNFLNFIETSVIRWQGIRFLSEFFIQYFQRVLKIWRNRVVICFFIFSKKFEMSRFHKIFEKLNKIEQPPVAEFYSYIDFICTLFVSVVLKILAKKVEIDENDNFFTFFSSPLPTHPPPLLPPQKNINHSSYLPNPTSKEIMSSMASNRISEIVFKPRHVVWNDQRFPQCIASALKIDFLRPLQLISHFSASRVLTFHELHNTFSYTTDRRNNTVYLWQLLFDIRYIVHVHPIAYIFFRW